MGGVVFDRYADNDFKFVAIDAQGDRLIFGHVDKRGLQIDNAVSRVFDAGVQYTLKLVLKGASVSATVNGAMVGSWGYNSAVVDGKVGVFAKGGASFDSVRVRTNDPAFESADAMTAAAGSAMAASTATVTQSDLDAAAQVAIAHWTGLLGAGDARLALLHDVRLGVDDLAGAQLGSAEGESVLIDADAAGHGWFIDPTPYEAGEFRLRTEGGLAATPGSEAYGRMDLLTVLTHELGHVMGFDHMAAGRLPVMAEELLAGMRYLVAADDAAARPAAPLAPRQDLLPDAGALPAPVKVEWQAPLGESWGNGLSSVYEPAKVKKAPTTNFADFAPVKPQGIFDSLGRALLGKGKAK
jgi:hypothetical protein